MPLSYPAGMTATAVNNGDVLTANAWNAIIADLITLFNGQADIQSRVQQNDTFSLLGFTF